MGWYRRKPFPVWAEKAKENVVVQDSENGDVAIRKGDYIMSVGERTYGVRAKEFEAEYEPTFYVRGNGTVH